MDEGRVHIFEISVEQRGLDTDLQYNLSPVTSVELLSNMYSKISGVFLNIMEFDFWVFSFQLAVPEYRRMCVKRYISWYELGQRVVSSTYRLYFPHCA